MKNWLCGFAFIIAMSTFGVSATTQVDDCKVDPNWTLQKINETLDNCRKKAESAMPAVLQNAVDYAGYAEVAKGVAMAIGMAARELGVAVDEFIKTDAGRLTAVLIVWHVAGDDIKSLFIGIPIIFFAVWFWFKATQYVRRSGEYITIKGMFGQDKSIHKLLSFKDMGGDTGAAVFLISVFSVILIIVALVSIF